VRLGGEPDYMSVLPLIVVTCTHVQTIELSARVGKLIIHEATCGRYATVF
jgi:hypothetical protein